MKLGKTLNPEIINEFLMQNHTLESDIDAQNDKHGQLLSPWTKQKAMKKSRRLNRIQLGTNQDQDRRGKEYSQQVSEIEIRPDTKVEYKVSFRLTFNSFRNRRKEYKSLEPEHRLERQTLITLRNQRQLFNQPKLMELDLNWDSKKIIQYNPDKMHRYSIDNDKTIQLNPYHRNRKQKDKPVSELSMKKQAKEERKLNVVTLDYISSSRDRGNTSKQRSQLKNYKMDRTIKTWRSEKPHCHSKGQKFVCCGDLINASTLHSSNRERLRKISILKDQLNSSQQEKFDSYLNLTLLKRK